MKETKNVLIPATIVLVLSIIFLGICVYNTMPIIKNYDSHTSELSEAMYVTDSKDIFEGLSYSEFAETSEISYKVTLISMYAFMLLIVLFNALYVLKLSKKPDLKFSYKVPIIFNIILCIFDFGSTLFSALFFSEITGMNILSWITIILFVLMFICTIDIIRANKKNKVQ